MRHLMILLSAVVLLLTPAVWAVDHSARAASAIEIDAKVDGTLKELYHKISGGKELAGRAKGILVFPSVLKAGFWIGGEFGEGALRIKGKTANYYNMAGASFGFQFGAQSKAVIMLFMTDGALNTFQNSRGWKAGVDGAVALATLGTGGSINTETLKSPIIGFVFSNKGLMVDVSLAGSKITQVTK